MLKLHWECSCAWWWSTVLENGILYHEQRRMVFLVTAVILIILYYRYEKNVIQLPVYLWCRNVAPIVAVAFGGQWCQMLRTGRPWQALKQYSDPETRKCRCLTWVMNGTFGRQTEMVCEGSLTQYDALCGHLQLFPMLRYFINAFLIMPARFNLLWVVRNTCLL